MQIKYYLTPVKMAIIKQKDKRLRSIVKGVEIRDLLCTIGGNVNWYSHYRNSMELPQKN